jgi:hypothetical protein
MNPVDSFELHTLELTGDIETARQAGDFMRNLIQCGEYSEERLAKMEVTLL